jgi:hypothetical protein
LFSSVIFFRTCDKKFFCVKSTQHSDQKQKPVTQIQWLFCKKMAQSHPL